jgi:hypothetical protein
VIACRSQGRHKLSPAVTLIRKSMQKQYKWPVGLDEPRLKEMHGKSVDIGHRQELMSGANVTLSHGCDEAFGAIISEYSCHSLEVINAGPKACRDDSHRSFSCQLHNVVIAKNCSLPTHRNM